MSIRFKFRSSLNFESVDIGERDSITVADLKSNIRRRRNVNVSSGDCDLVLSDALTGLEYTDDHMEIRSGSSVIIKRVPASSVNAAVCLVNHDQPSAICNANAEAPVLATQGENLLIGNDGRMLPPGLKSVDHDILKSQKCGKPPSITSKDKLSLEFKCSLCDQFYRAAVMIPCCQNSFCELCIRQELINNMQCPSCSSTKYRVEDLLPNISLRHAVEHFLESRAIFDETEGCPYQQVSDGESGINAKDDSGDVTILEGDNLVRSSVFNEIGGDTVECLKFRTNTFTANNLEDKSLSCKGIHVNDEEVGSSCPRGTELVYPDCQGESESIQKQGGDICSLEAERVKKQGVRDCFMCGSSDHLIKQCPVARAHGVRACYICGSFDHLMRDCQEAPVHRHTPGIGEIFPFWNVFSLNYAINSEDQIRGSMVSAFNPPMFPGATFSAPSNMPITYGGLPAYRGFMRYGWTPYVAGMAANQYLTSQGLTDFEKRSDDNVRRTDCQNMFNKSFSSEQLENHHHGCGGIHFTVGSGNKSLHGSNHPSHGEQRSSVHYELSFSDREHSPGNSDYHDNEGSHHSRSSMKHGIKMGRPRDDDLSRSHGQSDKRDLKRNRTERVPAQRSEKHPRSLDRGSQRHGVEAEVDVKCSHSSRDSKHRQASRREERNGHDCLARERWRMTSRSDEKMSRGAVTITKAERNSRKK